MLSILIRFDYNKIIKAFRFPDSDFSSFNQFKQSDKGYDDSYFHIKVIPEMGCPKCGKKAKDSYRPLATKYADSEVI